MVVEKTKTKEGLAGWRWISGVLDKALNCEPEPRIQPLSFFLSLSVVALVEEGRGIGYWE